jgi:probable HAF family extracellular repeat protein
MTDLGTLPDDVSSSAWGINDRGQVVGQSCDQQGNCRAVLWQNGTITDLNAITHKPTSFELLGAEAINDQGVIVGPVYDPARGTSYAYAATPCGDRTAANQHCAHSGPLTTRNAAAKATLPAAIRAQLQRRKRFGPFGGL